MPRRPLRSGPGAPWPDSAAKRAWARRVFHAVEVASAEVRALGITATVSVNWTSDHGGLVVRCLILTGGLPNPEEREKAAFAGGYIAGRLVAFEPALWYAGQGQNLLLKPPKEEDAHA